MSLLERKKLEFPLPPEPEMPCPPKLGTPEIDDFLKEDILWLHLKENVNKVTNDFQM